MEVAVEGEWWKPKYISGHCPGKSPWNKGKKLSEETKRRMARGQKGRKHTEESKKKIAASLLGRKILWVEKISKAMTGRIIDGEWRRKISQATRKRYEDPIERAYDYAMQHRGMAKNLQWYISPTAGKVPLRSSYEVIMAKWLDENRKEWKYEGIVTSYIGRDEREHNYYVDFYLPKEKKCIEVKGWVSDVDKLKFEAFRKQHPELKLEVYGEKEIRRLECQIRA